MGIYVSSPKVSKASVFSVLSVYGREDALELLRYLASLAIGTGVITTIAAFTLKKLISHWLDKNVEAYKTKLQTDLEEHKTNLQKIAFEHQIRFSRLHERRAKVICKLYSKLVEMAHSIRSFMDPVQWVGDLPQDEKGKIAEKDVNDFIRFYKRNRILFLKNVCELIEEIIKQIHDAWVTYDIYVTNWKSSSSGVRPDPRKWIKSFEIVSEKVPEIEKQLEDEFRTLLGVQEIKL